MVRAPAHSLLLAPLAQCIPELMWNAVPSDELEAWRKGPRTTEIGAQYFTW